MGTIRVESDFLGKVNVPSDALYGIFTIRALENFKISELSIDDMFIKTLAEVKKAAAYANADLGFLDLGLSKAIVKAADEVIAGKHQNMFPLDVFHAGAGTPWNMNMNEVLAKRANQILGSLLGSYSPVHPNDHVNMAQSSNDVIPNTIRLTVLKLCISLVQSLNELEKALRIKADEFMEVRKSGRTHLQDAVPISLGQEFNAYASAVENGRRRVNGAGKRLRNLFLGGTAVGTGLNTHPEYHTTVLNYLGKITSLELNTAKDFVEKTQFESDFLSYADALAALAVDLVKINNDLMLLASGPATGLGEILLPMVEPGSSIMPGKVNPSILECVNMVCFQAMGGRVVVENAAKFGTLDLNVYTPVIAFNLFTLTRWLTNAVNILTERCVKGIKSKKEATEYYFDYSKAVVTLLNPVIGYKAAAELSLEAVERGMKVWDLILEKGVLTEEQIDELIAHSCQPNMHIVKKISEAEKKEEQ